MNSPEKMVGVRVLCIGDIMLDRYVSGHVTRISPESPVPVLSIADTQDFPGGAANVARNIAALGGVCTLVGIVGGDRAADDLSTLLQSNDRIRSELLIDPERPTSEKVRLTSQGHHMLRADTELSLPIGSDMAERIIEAIQRLAPDCDVLLLSDYAKGLLTDEVIRAAISVAHTLRLPVIVDPKSTDLRRYAGATVLTPNSVEVMEATGIDPTENDDDAMRAGLDVLRMAEVNAVLVTRARHGMTLVDADKTAVHIPTRAREVFDVVGASDTVMATLSLAVGAGLPLRVAATLANAAAGLVVGRVGTATITQTELADELARLQGSSLDALKSKILTCEELLGLTKVWRSNAFSVGFTNGCFDLLHIGHLSLLHFAKQNCGKLVVAVNSDASVRRLKEPDRPINPQMDRAMVLAALGAVDAVIIFEEDTPLDLITQLSPDVLVKGADYTIDNIVGASYVLERGGKVLRCDLVNGKSTSAVVRELQGRSPPPSSAR